MDEARRFGRFEIRPLQRRLLVDGWPAAIGSRAFDLLLALAERPGELLTKRELLDRVWPDTVVEENNLQVQVGTLRKLLGGDAIATIPGRGYRLTAPPAHPAGSEADPAAAAPAPAVAEAPRPHTNLPRPLPALLGRADDLAALSALAEQHALVSIVGAGGIGKTLLAQHLLDARQASYRHGVCWVELAAVSDAAALPAAVAAALGVRPGTGEPLAGLCAAVAPLQLLLALDNAEHLLDGVAQLAQALLAAAPQAKLLVTSQAPLKLPAERVYRIGALAVPQGPLPAAKAIEFGAVALFVERAQAVDARFALTDANAAAVIELCRALDGLALAIELAAARARMLGVHKLAAAMHDRLKLLNASRNRAAPARQQTLRAALEWSHGFLDARERAVFRRLGVFAGGASLAMVQRVCADEDGALDEWAVLDALGVLVDRSLVAVLSDNDSDADAEPRYRLLDSPRAYALEQLRAAGEEDALRRRHADALADRFDAAWDERYSGRIGLSAWDRRMSADLDNARDALAWARAGGEPLLSLRLAVGLLHALPRSLYAERVALAEACEPLIEPCTAAPLQRRAWLALAFVLDDRQQGRRSLHAAQQAVRLARAQHAPASDAFELYLPLCRLAIAMASVGEPLQAEAALREAEAIEDPHWPPQRLRYRAYVGCWVFDAAARLRWRRTAHALTVASGGDGSGELAGIVDGELAAGDAAAAARSGTALLAALEGGRDEFSRAYAQLHLSAAWLALDDTRQARRIAEGGFALGVRFGMQAHWTDYLALLAALEGRSRAAARLAGCADARNAARGTREPNEAAAIERATALARAALGELQFGRLHAEGAGFSDADIERLAFATEDAA